MRHVWTTKCGQLLKMLPGTLVVASLTGCTIVHLDGDPGGTPPLKQAVDGAAETAVEFGTKNGSVQHAWRDGAGTWHWTEVDQSGGTLQCEGPKVGTPTLCD